MYRNIALKCKRKMTMLCIILLVVDYLTLLNSYDCQVYNPGKFEEIEQFNMFCNSFLTVCRESYFRYDGKLGFHLYCAERVPQDVRGPTEVIP